MNSRALASIALGAAVLLGATGCSMISPQATTLHYSAAEGMNVPDSSGPVDIRNVFFVTDDDGETANLIAAFVNETMETQRATVQLVGEGNPVAVDLDAKSVVSFGVDGDDMLFENIGAPAGSTVNVAFQSGDGQVVEVEVPVLDGALLYLQDSVPAGE